MWGEGLGLECFWCQSGPLQQIYKNIFIKKPLKTFGL
jgi:hypothetical protein